MGTISRRTLLTLLPLVVIALLFGWLPGCRTWVQAFLAQHQRVRMPRARRVQMPLFVIQESLVICMTEVRQRRFDLIDRSALIAHAETAAAEDRRVFELLDSAV